MGRRASPSNKERDVELKTLDWGTGFSTIGEAIIVDGTVSTINPFSQYDRDPAVRQGGTSEVPSVCGHFPGTNKNPLYGFQVDAATDTDKTGIEIVYNLKAGLYSKNDENVSSIQKLTKLAKNLPYLVARYKNTELRHNPETWLAADFIRHLVELADSPTAKWRCSIPSNYTQNSKRLYIEMLNLAGLKGRVELSAEVVAAFEWFTRQGNPSVEHGQVVFVIDFGAGTTDFGCFRNNDGIYEEMMRSDAISMGPSNLFQLAEDYIRKKCKKCGDDEDLKLFGYRRQFMERMHVFDPLTDATDIDHSVNVGKETIKVTSGKMAKWFTTYTKCIDKFLSKKFEEYSSVYKYHQKPSKVFLFGGGSQARPVITLLEQKMAQPLFGIDDTDRAELVQANSSTSVATGLAHLHASPRKQYNRSYRWFGIIRLERYNESTHANAPESDVVMDEKDKFITCVQWLLEPGIDCEINSEVELLNVEMVALVKTAPVQNVTIGVCITKNVPDAVVNTTRINGRKWSYQSNCNESDISSFDFKIRLLEKPLGTYKNFPEVHFTIFAEATIIGADIHCKVTDPEEASRRLIGRINEGGLISIMSRVYEERGGENNKNEASNTADEFQKRKDHTSGGITKTSNPPKRTKTTKNAKTPQHNMPAPNQANSTTA